LEKGLKQSIFPYLLLVNIYNTSLLTNLLYLRTI